MHRLATVLHATSVNVHQSPYNRLAWLYSVIKRIMGLISRGAQLEAASEAAMRQAESASKAAKSLMNAVCLPHFYLDVLYST